MLMNNPDVRTQVKAKTNKRIRSRLGESENKHRMFTVEWYVHEAVYFRWEGNKWSKSLYVGLRNGAAQRLRAARRIDSKKTRELWTQWHKKEQVVVPKLQIGDRVQIANTKQKGKIVQRGHIAKGKSYDFGVDFSKIGIPVIVGFNEDELQKVE